MSVIDDSALDYEEDEEQESVSVNPADEDTLLGADDEEVEEDEDENAAEEHETGGDVLDVQLSDEEMSEFPTSETPAPPEVTKPPTPAAAAAKTAADQARPPVWESAPPFEEPGRDTKIYRTIQTAPGAAGGQAVTHALPPAGVAAYLSGGQSVPLQPAAGHVAAYPAVSAPPAVAAGLGHLPAGLAASAAAPAPVVVPVLVNTAVPPPGFSTPAAPTAPTPAAAAPAPAAAKTPATSSAPPTNAVDKFTQEFIQSNHRSLYGGGSRRETSEHSSTHHSSRERSPLRSQHHRTSSRDRGYERDYERDYQRDYESRQSRQTRDRSPADSRHGAAPSAASEPPPPPPPPYHQETETEEMRQYRREYEVREAEWRARKEKALKVKELRRQLRQAEAEAGLVSPEPARPRIRQ